jgi:hypothetical protein
LLSLWQVICLRPPRISGDIDYHDSTRDGKPSVEWSWDGNDELDAAKGRGWAVIDGDRIHGVIAIHHGDESEFEAIRKEQTMAKKKLIKPVGKARRTKQIANQAIPLTEFAAKAYIAAYELQIKEKPVTLFPLNEDEQATVAEILVLPTNLKKKLAKKNSAFTIDDVASMVMVECPQKMYQSM